MTDVTPLYEAIGKCDWDAASHACLRNPNEAKTWVVRRDTEQSQGEESGDNNRDKAGNIPAKILWRILPLHSACARNPPSTFVSQLITAYPEAVSQKDNSGMYPLHYACGNRASRNVVKQLIETFPQAIREADPQGMTPLHYIAQWGPSEDDIVELLLDEHAEGVLVLNGEEMCPLDLCREANYNDWEKVLAEMEKSLLTKRQRGGGVGGDSGRSGVGIGGKQLSVARNIRNMEEEQKDSLLSSTIEVRGKITPSSLFITRQDQKSQSKLISSHGPELVEASTQCDARDEVSTPRSHHNNDRGTTPRSYQSILAARSRGSLCTSHTNAPHSIICSVASPRYHDMKTPRSSGRGPGFSFASTTPSSSRNSLDSNYEREPYTRRNDDRGGRTGNHLKSNPPSLTSSLSQLSVRFEGGHGSFRPSLTFEVDSLEKKDRQSKQHLILNRKSQEKANVSYRSLGEQQSFETMQAENAQLHAKLMNYLTIQNENRQLHAQLANYHAVCQENQALHVKLAKLQDIQNEFSEIFDFLQRQESLRVSVSANRKKFLLEMLAAEDNLNHEEQCGVLYKGEMLQMAIGRQIANIGQLRNEMGHR